MARSLIALCVVGLVMCGGCSKGETTPTGPSGPSPDSRLVAFYPFSGSANDESGRGNHGVVVGAVLRADRRGAANAAYEFNGASEINAPISLRSSSMTAMAWINPRAAQCWGGIFDAYPDQWEFVTDCVSGDSLELAEWRSPSVFFDRVDSARLSMNRWSHVAVTVDGLVGRFYVDGVQTSSFSLSAPLLSSPTRLYIGHSKSGTSQYFAGGLDELRLYSAPLTATEIRSAYESSR